MKKKPIILEKPGKDNRYWNWAYIEGHTVIKGEGFSPYSGQEHERQTSKYKVKNPKKTIERLKKEGYS